MVTKAKTAYPPLSIKWGELVFTSQCQDCTFGESGRSSMQHKASSAEHVLNNPGHTVDETETRHRTVTRSES